MHVQRQHKAWAAMLDVTDVTHRSLGMYVLLAVDESKYKFSAFIELKRLLLTKVSDRDRNAKGK